MYRRQQYIDTYILNINIRKRIIIQQSNVLAKEMENVNTQPMARLKGVPGEDNQTGTIKILHIATQSQIWVPTIKLNPMSSIFLP